MAAKRIWIVVLLLALSVLTGCGPLEADAESQARIAEAEAQAQQAPFEAQVQAVEALGQAISDQAQAHRDVEIEMSGVMKEQAKVQAEMFRTVQTIVLVVGMVFIALAVLGTAWIYQGILRRRRPAGLLSSPPKLPELPERTTNNIVVVDPSSIVQMVRQFREPADHED